MACLASMPATYASNGTVNIEPPPPSSPSVIPTTTANPMVKGEHDRQLTVLAPAEFARSADIEHRGAAVSSRARRSCESIVAGIEVVMSSSLFARRSQIRLTGIRRGVYML